MGQLGLTPLYILLCAALVFVMQLGFLCLEAGYCRKKNNINVAAKNICDFGMTAIIFWGFGYAIGFGDSFKGLFGTSNFFFSANEHNLLPTSIFIYQMMFAGTAVTILSGAIAERMKFIPYIIAALFISGFIYPVYAHWAWNIKNHQAQGWLASAGFIDFAGTSVVHCVGGWISLAALIVVGPRVDRFEKDGTAREIPASNLPFALLGVLLLWVGWFGFNCGSAYNIPEKIPLVFLNTILGGAAGLVMSIAISLITRPSFVRISWVANGTLAGIVAVTGACHIITPEIAVIAGAIGSVISIKVENLLLKWGIDDVVGAIPVHLGAGIWGTLVVIFGDLIAAGTGFTIWRQLEIQLLGLICCGCWTFGMSYLMFKILNRVVPLRITEEEEHQGLNFSEHGQKNDLMSIVTLMNEQAKFGDLSLRLPEEPFSQVGEFARAYNRVINSLQKTTTHISKLIKTEEILQGKIVELRFADEKIKEAFQESQQARKKAEEQSQQLLEQAKALTEAQTQALQANLAKTAFLSHMSHEIRIPLTAILGYAERIISSNQLSSDIHKSVDLILTNGKHLLQIINDTLDLSKIESGALQIEKSPVDLSDLFTEVHSLLDGKALDKNLTFKITVKQPLPKTIITDYLRLKQVIINLVGNAIKFTEFGLVELAVSWIDQSSELSLIVSDTGIGMTSEQMQKLFQPFVQADQSISKIFGGTGLGLSISKKIIEALGGRITFESTLGQGTTFKLILPAEVSKISPSKHSNAQDENALPVLKGKVLVADDTDDIRDLICYFLKSSGAIVKTATNGSEAIEMALSEDFDVILMDIQMDVMDGTTAVKFLRAKDFIKPIIAITANQLTHEIEHFLKAGFTDTLSKPFEKGQLITIVDKYLQNSNALPKTFDERQRIISLFVGKLPTRIYELEEAVLSGNYSNASALAHRLASAGLFGFEELGNVAHNLESACKDQMGKEANKLMSHLKSLAEKIITIQKSLH